MLGLEFTITWFLSFVGTTHSSFWAWYANVRHLQRYWTARCHLWKNSPTFLLRVRRNFTFPPVLNITSPFILREQTCCCWIKKYNNDQPKQLAEVDQFQSQADEGKRQHFFEIVKKFLAHKTFLRPKMSDPISTWKCYRRCLLHFKHYNSCPSKPMWHHEGKKWSKVDLVMCSKRFFSSKIWKSRNIKIEVVTLLGWFKL